MFKNCYEQTAFILKHLYTLIILSFLGVAVAQNDKKSNAFLHAWSWENDYQCII